MAPSSADGSSTSPTTPSRSSRRSAPGPSTSGSRGRSLGRRALTDLAARHGIRPRKALGQHFLADANVARAIAREVGAERGVRVVEIGAGLGSLTAALGEAGAEVLAMETDPRLVPALAEVVAGLDVEIMHADAMEVDWPGLLGDGRWRMASNLPYNLGTTLVVRLLEEAPSVDPMVVMVQREAGERLAAPPGSAAYGAVTVKVAYRAGVRVVRRVPPSVFWPEPAVESVVLRLDCHAAPVDVPADELFRVVEEGFAQRRKTMASALVRLGLARDAARDVLIRAGLDPRVRGEALDLRSFARVAEAMRD